jgi:POT family proton-dependent oligopeptide transporter
LIGAALAEGEGASKNLTNYEKLLQYTEGYGSIGFVALGAGVVLILISPVLRKQMQEVK